MKLSTPSKNFRLLIAPAISIWNFQNKYYLDRKFVEGLLAYSRNWPGPIRLAMSSINIQKSSSFGMIPADAIPDSIELIVLPKNGILQRENLKDVNCVLASADNFRLRKSFLLCRLMQIPLIHDIEYTLQTRVDFLKNENRPIYKFLRTWIWLYKQELYLRIALKKADAIQANGLPAFNAYRKDKRDDLVYFDSRISSNTMVTTHQLERRLEELQKNRPIRLAFSGRLMRAKGADALIEVAMQLRKLNVSFFLDIFGSGEEELSMQKCIRDNNLSSFVRMHGAVDFETTLVPWIRDQIDVFICCHRQGDPSCTYIETYGCGVPIAGFANEAHQSILAQEDVGWSVPMDNTYALAKLILRLERNREEICQKSIHALNFANKHLFESTFSRRMKHCLQFVV